VDAKRICRIAFGGSSRNRALLSRAVVRQLLKSDLEMHRSKSQIDVWDKPGLGVIFNVRAAKTHLTEEDRDFFD
jgi:hypothetical protein